MVNLQVLSSNKHFNEQTLLLHYYSRGREYCKTVEAFPGFASAAS